MATKTISLELDAYEKLKQAKREGESFSAVVRRAHFGPSDASGGSILEALKILPVREVDRKAAERWEKHGLPERTISPEWRGFKTRGTGVPPVIDRRDAGPTCRHHP